jgi:hypothetical protein
MMVILAILGGAVGIFGVLWYTMSRAGAPTEDEYFWFRCPGCRQKLRCSTDKAGREGKCPRCKRSCTLPASSQQLEKHTNNLVGRRLVRQYA